MDYSRIRDFIMSYSKDDEGLLGDVYSKAIEKDVPIIRRDTADFLKVMISIVRPKNVLEVGTAVAYSTIFIATVLDSIHKSMDWHIDTCEMDEERIAEAEKNISSSDYKDNINLIKGDAALSLKSLDGSYDLVFIDAAKAQYMDYLDESLRLSHPGTVIITDNILSDGDVLESHFLVEKRDRTIHDRMRDYLYRIKNDERLETAILSIGDGVAVSVCL